jgi:hypothetical protein
MNNDRPTANVKPAAKPTKTSTPDAHAKRPGGERASLPGERAEGEGMIAPEPTHEAGLEGEGSYTATHRYDEGVARSVAAGKSEELGKKAAKALDGPEGDELREAEKAAKQGHSH